MTKARRHHYLPVHMVQYFCDESDGQVHCYDKLQKRFFKTPPKNVCAERDFHALKIDDYIVSYEDWITQIELSYQETLAKVCESKSLCDLNADEAFTLCIMSAFQFVRTKGHREHYSEFVTEMHEKVSKIAESAGAKFDEQVPNDNELVVANIKQIQESVPKYAEMLFDKIMFLIHASDEMDFWIGDDPVVLHNDNNYRPYGNIGFSVPGIQIYHPISPNLTLAYWCPMVIGKARRDIHLECTKMVGSLLSANTHLEKVAAENERKVLVAEKKRRDDWANQITHEKYLVATSEHMKFHNAMQLENTTRMIISKSGDFSEVKKMLAHNPKYALRPKRFTM